MPGDRTAPRRAAAALSLAAVVAVAACSSGDDGGAHGFTPIPDGRPTSTATDPSGTSTTSTVPDSSTVEPTTSTSTTTTSTTTTTIDPLTVRHAFPIGLDVTSSWTPEAHANYRATDVFASSDCGTPLLSPVAGVVDEVLVDRYDRDNDDPALRGGNAVSIIGDDGVRYYMAHFQAFDPSLTAGMRVEPGQLLGQMGDTGRAGACHVHFGLSLPCPGDGEDWWVRRGVIWPDQYLASWKEGGNLSPLPELQEWFAEYPNACNSVDDTPYPRA
jgi:murein DD-endopeptidase MepM/ murein hydrolase activator NlpD